MSAFPFADAVQGGDFEAAIALLADDVSFRSPVVHSPYHGREAVGVLLRAVSRVFENFRYTRMIGDERDHALVFEARVGDREIEGCDFIRTRPDGLISEFTVMVRPLSGALALAEAMRAQLSTPDG